VAHGAATWPSAQRLAQRRWSGIATGAPLASASDVAGTLGRAIELWWLRMAAGGHRRGASERRRHGAPRWCWPEVSSPPGWRSSLGTAVVACWVGLRQVTQASSARLLRSEASLGRAGSTSEAVGGVRSSLRHGPLPVGGILHPQMRPDRAVDTEIGP
jgi:hypothetical protein